MSNCTNNFIKRVIGVTRTFNWTITTNGAAVPLVAEDLTLQLVPPRGEAVSLPFDVDDNIVSFTWQGKDQHIIGCYSLILWANFGEENQRRVDIHNFVELIPWSDRQSGEYSDLVEETIELETADFGENIMVVDNLNSTSATDALSANMGRQLNVTKQDVIQDLATIRSGAAAGAAVKEWAKNDPLITDDGTQVSASKLAFNGNIFEQWVPGIASSIGLKGIAGFLKVADISQWDSAYNDRMLPTVAAVKAKLQAVLTALGTIEAVIPSQASSTNKLTDKDYVDGAIATNTANFVGTFDSLAELQAVQNPTKNDYGFVIESDAQGNEYYDRYKYTGTQWLFEYKVESTPFTAEQWAAIQSGITAALVTKLSALPTNAELTTALASKQPVINDLTTIRSGAAAGATAYQKPSGGIPKTDLASAVQTSLGKADAAAPQSTTYTKTEVDAALATKQTSSQIATINGSDITHGGNVTIVAAEGQTITIDAAPTKDSNNAVSSGGVYAVLNGGTETQTITRYSTLSDRRIPNNGSTWTASAATGYAIDSFAVTTGQTYHLLVPKMSNAYTAVYSFGIEGQGQTALPDPVIVGPATNAEYDITIPSGITALFVCYQSANGTPTLTTQVAAEGLIDKVDDIDERLGEVEEQVSTVPELNVDMYGGESVIEVEAKSVATGYRMTNLGKITTSVASTSAVASYPVTAGETYRVQIPSVKDSYQAAYGFHTRVPNTDSQITLPSPAVVGPVTNGDYSVTIPTGYSYLIVSYEFAAGSPTITYEGEIPGVKADVATLKDEMAALEHNSAEIRLPNKYYAVVGDVLQIFRRGVIKAANPYNHNVMFTCAKGANYPRYWRLYPTQASDVGTYPMTVTVTNDYGDVLATAPAEVDIVSAPSSPASSKRFVCFGDSVSAHGEWPSEAFRRLTGTGGTPTGKGLTNIAFCGPMNKDGAGYFGVGGWSWANYISAGSPAFRFQVSNVEALYIGASYTNNGYTYTIREINVTGGAGNILCATSAATNTPTASGTLTKSSGDGDSTIAFSSASADASNPFWNYTNNQLDFQSFADTYCNGTIDCMVSMLGWNGRTKYETDFDAIKASVRTFLNAYHTAFPLGKFILLGINGCSPIGGMGANYGSNQDYSDWYGMMVSCLNLKRAYQELANEDDYASFVTFVDVAGQFDADYNLPTLLQGVNSRNDSQTELLGLNGVHPSEAGYGQIADAVYRAIVALFCQGS